MDLKAYLDTLTPDGRRAFASRAGSSVESLRQAACAYRKAGVVDLHPEFSARIEKASHGAVPREVTSRVCARCPYCKG